MLEHQSKRSWPSKGFFLILTLLGVGAIAAKPTLRWGKAQYDRYQGRNIVPTATESEYQRLLAQIRTQQPGKMLELQRVDGAPVSEQIFQAALSPELLGRSSRYEPYTHNGKLACAWMVNMVLVEVLGQRVGENPLFVPSMVEELDGDREQQLSQGETLRGDLAISNGTDYEEGQWHIGICATDGCELVLSNSPFSSSFSWLTDANFDGAFEQYPGETTFYRMQSSS